MDSKHAWLRLIPAVVTLLGGCATPSDRLVPVPCLEPVPPPARLMTPPESPATRQRLEQLLPSTSKPASETPSASASSSGG